MYKILIRLALYIVICAWSFAMLDWQVIHYTRIANRDWLEWMHNHEAQYSLVVRTPELILCAPALALRPLFYEAIVDSTASQEEQESIIHAPRISWKGFYHLPVRSQSWTFVSWTSWFLSWLVPSIIWVKLWQNILHK